MTRNTWRRPLRGGMYFSISSVNRISPTLSLLRMAEKASTEAISAASSRLAWSSEPNSRAADIHDEHQGELAFLHEFLYERMIHPGGDVPIDRAHFIARLIFAHLFEV